VPGYDAGGSQKSFKPNNGIASKGMRQKQKQTPGQDCEVIVADDMDEIEALEAKRAHQSQPQAGSRSKKKEKAKADEKEHAETDAGGADLSPEELLVLALSKEREAAELQEHAEEQRAAVQAMPEGPEKREAEARLAELEAEAATMAEEAMAMHSEAEEKISLAVEEDLLNAKVMTTTVNISSFHQLDEKPGKAYLTATYEDTDGQEQRFVSEVHEEGKNLNFACSFGIKAVDLRGQGSITIDAMREGGVVEADEAIGSVSIPLSSLEEGAASIKQLQLHDGQGEVISTLEHSITVVEEDAMSGEDLLVEVHRRGGLQKTNSIGLASVFSEMDTDGDGKISKKEVNSIYSQDIRNEELHDLDINGDGKISKSELKQVDLDGDGIISEPELNHFRKSRMADDGDPMMRTQNLSQTNQIKLIQSREHSARMNQRAQQAKDELEAQRGAVETMEEGPEKEAAMVELERLEVEAAEAKKEAEEAANAAASEKLSLMEAHRHKLDAQVYMLDFNAEEKQRRVDGMEDGPEKEAALLELGSLRRMAGRWKAKTEQKTERILKIQQAEDTIDAIEGVQAEELAADKALLEEECNELLARCGEERARIEAMADGPEKEAAFLELQECEQQANIRLSKLEDLEAMDSSEMESRLEAAEDAQFEAVGTILAMEETQACIDAMPESNEKVQAQAALGVLTAGSPERRAQHPRAQKVSKVKQDILRHEEEMRRRKEALEAARLAGLDPEEEARRLAEEQRKWEYAQACKARLHKAKQDAALTIQAAERGRAVRRKVVALGGVVQSPKDVKRRRNTMRRSS